MGTFHKNFAIHMGRKCHRCSHKAARDRYIGWRFFTMQEKRAGQTGLGSRNLVVSKKKKKKRLDEPSRGCAGSVNKRSPGCWLYVYGAADLDTSTYFCGASSTGCSPAPTRAHHAVHTVPVLQKIVLCHRMRNTTKAEPSRAAG